MRTPLLALVAVGLLAGCGNNQSRSAAMSAPATTATPTTATRTAVDHGGSDVTARPTVDVSPQGFLRTPVGQETGLGCKVGRACPVRFTVTAVDINPPCDRAREPAPAGRKTVVLHVTMTVAEPTARQANIAGLVFSQFNLKGLDEAGKVSSVETGHCLDRTDQLDRDILPNTTTEGTVEVTMSETATSIASSSTYLDDGTRGWVWPIGG